MLLLPSRRPSGTFLSPAARSCPQRCPAALQGSSGSQPKLQPAEKLLNGGFDGSLELSPTLRAVRHRSSSSRWKQSPGSSAPMSQTLPPQQQTQPFVLTKPISPRSFAQLLS